MGGSWQSQDQRDFIKGYLPSYSLHSEKDTLKTAFWPDFLSKWFEKWPLPEPDPGVVGEGNLETARKADRTKKVNVSVVCAPIALARTYHLGSN